MFSVILFSCYWLKALHRVNIISFKFVFLFEKTAACSFNCYKQFEGEVVALGICFLRSLAKFCSRFAPIPRTLH